MPSIPIPCVFMRGGTSKALIFHARDLPAGREEREAILLGAMGSPDPASRQLDGMGGGLSSLSKAAIVAPSSRPDADVDFTFAQVLIREARVDWKPNCGNISAAIGPFAIDEGLVRAQDGEALVRIFNTNTGKLIHARFPVSGGRAEVDGDLEIPGVAGTGAPVRLDFVAPGGAVTGRLLPSGNATDTLDVPGIGTLAVSLVDAANPTIFIRAADLGLTGTELPDELEATQGLLERLQSIRRAASRAMGIAATEEEAMRSAALPYLALLAPPADAPTLSGTPIAAEEADLTVRVLASGQIHRALPLTVSLCTAVASRIPGTIASAMLQAAGSGPVRLAMPSGVLSLAAEVEQDSHGIWQARSGAFYRTARRLFDGRVWARRPDQGSA